MAVSLCMDTKLVTHLTSNKHHTTCATSEYRTWVGGTTSHGNRVAVVTRIETVSLELQVHEIFLLVVSIFSIPRRVSKTADKNKKSATT